MVDHFVKKYYFRDRASQGERWHLKWSRRVELLEDHLLTMIFSEKNWTFSIAILSLVNWGPIMMNNKLGLGEPGICRV